MQDINVLPARAASSRSAKASLSDDEFGPAVDHLSPDMLTMDFGGIATFVIDFKDRTVRVVAAHPDADQDTIDHFADDHVAPRIIAADGTLVLHGSATVVGSRMAAFLGETGSGKSTFAASMHAAGHRLLGDDAVVIGEDGGTLWGESVYPSLRLYRESIDQVFRESVATSAMAFYSDKLHVAADDLGRPEPEQYPLGAIFFLTEGGTGATLEPVYPSDACMALVENSFALDPFDRASAVQRMAQAARLAAAVPCYELIYPHDFAKLGEARAQVIAALAHPSTPA